VKSYLVKWKRDGDSKRESDAHELEVEWKIVYSTYRRNIYKEPKSFEGGLVK